MLERKDDLARYLYHSRLGSLDLCDELAEGERLGNDGAMMEYTNKPGLPAISFLAVRVGCYVLLCCWAARPGIV
jgi:hypothetical protein